MLTSNKSKSCWGYVMARACSKTKNLIRGQDEIYRRPLNGYMCMRNTKKYNKKIYIWDLILQHNINVCTIISNINWIFQIWLWILSNATCVLYILFIFLIFLFILENK